MSFISSKNLFFFLRYLISFNCFSFLFTIPRFKDSIEAEIIRRLRTGKLSKLLLVTFGITQKPLCIKSAKSPR